MLCEGLVPQARDEHISQTNIEPIQYYCNILQHLNTLVHFTMPELTKPTLNRWGSTLKKCEEYMIRPLGINSFISVVHLHVTNH